MEGNYAQVPSLAACDGGLQRLPAIANILLASTSRPPFTNRGTTRPGRTSRAAVDVARAPVVGRRRPDGWSGSRQRVRQR